jgi:hypothetical protein
VCGARSGGVGGGGNTGSLVCNHGGVEVGHQAELPEFVRERREDKDKEREGKKGTEGRSKDKVGPTDVALSLPPRWTPGELSMRRMRL